MAIPINKRKVDAINEMVNPTQPVEPINPASNGPVQEIKPTDTFTQNKNRQKELEGLIKSGQGSASVNAEYNRLTGNNQGARDVMLGSTEAQKTMQTTITPEEAGKMVQSGVTNVGEGVKPDMTAGTKEDFKQAMDTTKVTKQETPTGTVTTTETPKGTTKIETIDQFKQAGGGLSNLEQLVENRYGTIATQEADGSLSAIINGEKFKWSIDESGNPVKTSLGKVDQQTITPDMIYQSLLIGQSVDKNTPGYNDAKKRYDSYNMYSTMTDAQLSASIGKGIILPGTTLYEDLMKDPLQKARIEKIQKYNLITGNTPKTEDIFTNKSEEIANNTKVNIKGQDMTLAQAIEDGYISENEINSLTNNSEIITKAKEVENLKNEYDSALAIYNNVERDIKEQWKGTGATKTDIAVAVANAREKLLPGLQELESRTNNAIGTLTQMKADSAQLFATNLGLYQQQQQREQQLQDIQQQREYQTAQDVKNFEQQKEMLKLQQDYKNADIQTNTITDPATGKISLINSKTGETIKTFNTGLKPDTQTQDWAKLSDGTLYNQRTGETKTIQGTSTTPTSVNVTPSGNYANITYTMSSGTKKPIKVDSVAKDDLMNALNSIGKGLIVGDSFRDSARQEALYKELSAKGATVAKPGTSKHEKGLAVDIYSGKNAKGQLLAPTKEQVAIMNENGWFQTAGEDDKGHFEYLGKQAQPTQKQYTDNDIALLGSVTKLDKQGKETLRDNGYTEQDWANFNAGLLPPTKRQKADAKVIVDKVNDIFAGDWTDAVGVGLGKSRIFTGSGTDRKVTELKVQALKDLLAMANLDKIKGAMSDKDIEFLRNTATYLSTDLSEEEFEKTLNEIKNKYAGIYGGTPTVDTTGTSTQYKANSGKVYNLNDYK